jgi:hypothetical protein
VVESRPDARPAAAQIEIGGVGHLALGRVGDLPIDLRARTGAISLTLSASVNEAISTPWWPIRAIERNTSSIGVRPTLHCRLRIDISSASPATVDRIVRDLS